MINIHEYHAFVRIDIPGAYVKPQEVVLELYNKIRTAEDTLDILDLVKQNMAKRFNVPERAVKVDEIKYYCSYEKGAIKGKKKVNYSIG